MVDELNIGDDLSLNIDDDGDKKAGKKTDPGRKQKTLKLLVAVTAALVLTIGIVAVWLMVSGGEEVETDEEELPVEGELMDEDYVPFKQLVSLETIQVPLGDMGGNRMFKVVIMLDVDSAEAGQEILNRRVQIENSIKTIMASKTLGELLGSDGKIILKNELMRVLNRMLNSGRIKNLYFSEYLII